MKKNCKVGGQAVIEGVMMRGTKCTATAVRTEDGNINIDRMDIVSYTKKNSFFGLPIIRGFVSLIESLVIGLKTLDYSASFFEEDTEPTKFEKWLDKVSGGKSANVITVFSLCLSFIFAFFIFAFVPTAAAGIFKKYGVNSIALNLIEGLLRVTVFLLYIFAIGNMKDIHRLFQYHGAEHKTIFCYENEAELTPENAIKFKRFHPRCGTNFLFLVMIISIFVLSFTGWGNIWVRTFWRIILIPLISGITYEIIRWLGRSDSIAAKIVAYPGLMLQRLTTKEPDLDMLEVAIAALKAAEGIEDTNED